MLPIPARIFPITLESSSELEDPIDIFSLALTSGTLFPDHAITSHGDPGGQIGYASPNYEDIVLDIPKHPDEEGGRGLFAHYLWSAAAVAAAGIEQGSLNTRKRNDSGRKNWWDFKGVRALEVGAGTALPSITAALSHAESVYITDHPSSPALTTGSILSNVKRNLFSTLRAEQPDQTSQPRTETKVNILPHSWGQLSAPRAQALKSSFDKIIVADCMWLSSQHDNLITSILHFLKPLAPQAQSVNITSDNENVDPFRSSPYLPPCALVIAGYHTGRNIVSLFFTNAQSRGLTVQEIWEIDVGNAGSTIEDFQAYQYEPNGNNTDKEKSSFQRCDSGVNLGDIQQDGIPGYRRPWLPHRENEDKEQARKWVVVAILTKPEENNAHSNVHKEINNQSTHNALTEESSESVWDRPLRELNEKAAQKWSIGKESEVQIVKDGDEDNERQQEEIQEENKSIIQVDDVGWV